jgi:hypothetical protein
VVPFVSASAPWLKFDVYIIKVNLGFGDLGFLVLKKLRKCFEGMMKIQNNMVMMMNINPNPKLEDFNF